MANYPKAIGPYNAYRVVGNLVYCSGQIPLDPNSGEVIGDDIKAQTTQALKNIGGILKCCKNYSFSN